MLTCTDLLRRFQRHRLPTIVHERIGNISGRAFASDGLAHLDLRRDLLHRINEPVGELRRQRAAFLRGQIIILARKLLFAASTVIGSTVVAGTVGGTGSFVLGGTPVSVVGPTGRSLERASPSGCAWFKPPRSGRASNVLGGVQTGSARLKRKACRSAAHLELIKVALTLQVLLDAGRHQAKPEIGIL